MYNLFKMVVPLIATVFTISVIAMNNNNLATHTIMTTSEDNAPIVQEIFAQARLHTKPELATCKTLECIEALIYKESDEKLNTLFSNLQIPESEKKQFYARWKNKKQLYQKMLAEDPSTNHKQCIDEDGLGKPLVKATKNMLSKYNINPKKIDLTTVQIPLVYRLLPTFISKILAIDPPRGQATSTLGIAGSISFNRAHKKVEASDVDVISHEATHIHECHVEYIAEINKFTRDYYMQNGNRKEKFIELFKSFETEAELFPTVRFNNPLITEKLLKRKMPDCITEYSTGTLSKKWHTSPRFDTHPHCTELLPYILKIEDLKKQGAVSSYEKHA